MSYAYEFVENVFIGADMPYGIAYHQLAKINDSLFVLGGGIPFVKKVIVS